MIMRILSLMAGIFGEIGPGLILAAVLPFTLMAMGIVVGEVVRRVRHDAAETATG